MSALESLLHAAMAAPPARQEAALRILRGQAVAVDPAAATRASEPYLSIGDIAKHLSISASTLWRWKIPGHEFGGRARFRLSEVTAYVQSEAFRRRQAALRAERRDAVAAEPLPTLATAATGLADANSTEPGRHPKPQE